MKSARRVSSSVSDADAFSVVMKTETNTTSPRPIINAAAVDAVRRGLRLAFSCPRRPVIPRRRAGAPIAVASGLATNGDSTATPMKVNWAPSPTIAAGCGTSANSPAAIAPTPAVVSSPPTIARRRSDAVGATVPSRSASIGATREARRAGNTDATTVTTVPRTSAAMIVVGRIASGVGGSSSPISSRPCLSRTASPIPAASPRAEPRSPITRDSMTPDSISRR